MNLKFDRIISIATLIAALVAITLVLKKPAPVATPQSPASVTTPGNAAASAQSADQATPGVRQTEPPSAGSVVSGSTGSAASVAQTSAPTTPTAKDNPSLNSDQVSSAITKMLGSAGGMAALTPGSNVGSGEPVIKDQQVTMDGDIVHGRFLTEIAGKDVWVTISGHMGEKDGYATFDPTEFKVGDMEVPVSLVNPALQRKLAEERDRLKIPNNSDAQ